MERPEPIPELDLYAELEVVPSASPETIDAAWRSLVKRHHPDVTDQADPILAERIRRINVAHDWLADPDRRARYDRERATAQRATAQRTSWRTEAPTDRPPTGRGEEDWGSLRRERSRSWRSRRRRQEPVFSSPILVLGLLLFVVVIGTAGVLAVTAGWNFAPGSRPVAAASPTPDPRATAETPATTPTSRPIDAAGLADFLPDRIGGIALRGESGAAADLFAEDLESLDEMVARAGGRREGLAVAYKAGVGRDGQLLTIVGMSLESVAGGELAGAFREMNQADPGNGYTWSAATVAGREVSVSTDPDEPQVTAHLLSSSEAMFLVIASDAQLADAAIRALP